LNLAICAGSFRYASIRVLWLSKREMGNLSFRWL
jgi:hypothetical protein